METVEIIIERRAGKGKGAARRLRGRGLIPATIYGPRRSTQSVQLSALEFERKLERLEGAHLLRTMSPGGADPDLHEKMVLLRETQRQPVSGAVLHADLYEVDLTERLRVSVALHFVGKPAGVTEGGIMQPILREVEVECLPTEIPDFIEIDVSGLGIHDAVHVSELTLPAGVSAVAEAGQPVVTVLPPTVEVKPGEAAEAAAAPAAEGGAGPAAEGAAPAKKGGEG
ncbi:MAG: 50S ribosomal protein L25 [Candidatus Binatia bacterium]